MKIDLFILLKIGLGGKGREDTFPFPTSSKFIIKDYYENIIYLFDYQMLRFELTTLNIMKIVQAR